MIYDPALHERDICVKFNHLFFLQVCQWLDKYERHGVSDHRDLDCLFSSSSRLTTKKISKVHVTGPLWENPLVSNGFPAQMARRADSVSMSWRHHAIIETVLMICLLHKTLTKRVSGTRYYHSDIHKLYFNMRCHVSNISYLRDAMSNILNLSWEISRILFQYEHNDMHYEGKIIARPSQLYNGSSCAGKTSSQYIDVIMTTMASQITSLTVVNSTVLFRHRSKKTSKLRVTGLCAGNSSGPVNSPHKGPVTRKMFPFDDVIMFILKQPQGSISLRFGV